jgi:hypothetical protein
VIVVARDRERFVGTCKSVVCCNDRMWLATLVVGDILRCEELSSTVTRQRNSEGPTVLTGDVDIELREAGGVSGGCEAGRMGSASACAVFGLVWTKRRDLEPRNFGSPALSEWWKWITSRKAKKVTSKVCGRLQPGAAHAKSGLDTGAPHRSGEI